MVVGTLRGMPYRAASSVVAPDPRLVPGVFRHSTGALLALALLAGCGQRGPLVLPGAAHGASSPAASAPAASTPPPAAASAAR
ncbi:LPS translocon maturation chaperone LptM [Ideonella sp. YS5]|uniref:LPS translocon maturation chaperone LptM n=1 Tax=Ideonella sp. YS5 TaxID=3453714 RepID=UPI003EEA4697